MQKLTIQCHLILAALFCGAGPTAGADFEQGLAAFDRGDYAQALREWETAYPAMDDADAARAAFSLGWMYQKGEGVTQNTQKAMDWYRRAAAKGSAEACHMLGLMSSTTPPNRAVGGVFRDDLQSGGQGPAMVVLPTGSFRMGSPPGEAGRGSDEVPLRNVSERVEDCYHENYEGAPTDGRAWATNCDGSRRAVLRGGAWYNRQTQSKLGRAH